MVDFLKKSYYIKIRNYGRRKSRVFKTRATPAFALIILAVLVSGCASFTPDGDNQPLMTMIDVYRGPMDHLNPVRSGTCPMHPSCSAYAIESTEEHGPLVGWMMAFDRVMRCGRDELNYAPEIPVNGKWRYYDPVHANDFWWHAPDQISDMNKIPNQKE